MMQLTNSWGKPLLEEDEYFEPLPGSILMTEGIHGTAWQRMFSDGKWYSTRGGTPRPWKWLIKKRNVVLVYDAPVRKDRANGEEA